MKDEKRVKITLTSLCIIALLAVTVTGCTNRGDVFRDDDDCEDHIWYAGAGEQYVEHFHINQKVDLR